MRQRTGLHPEALRDLLAVGVMVVVLVAIALAFLCASMGLARAERVTVDNVVAERAVFEFDGVSFAFHHDGPGCPTTLDWEAGDIAVGDDGAWCVCLASGSPGDWVNVASTGITESGVRAALAAATATIDLNGQTISDVGTVDGRNLEADGTKLDGIEAGADDVDESAVRTALAASTGTIDLNAQTITDVGTVDGRDLSTDGTKLDGIEAGADDVDEAAVEAALGADWTDLTDSGATTLHSHAAPAYWPQVATVTIPGGSGAGSVGTLNTTAITVVAAQGSDTAIIPLGVHYWLDWASAAYDSVGPAETLVLFYAGGSDGITAGFDPTGFGNATADAHRWDYPDTENSAKLDMFENTAIQLKGSPAGSWYAAAGDSPIVVSVHYVVVDFTPSP